VALVRTDVSEEPSASFIRVTKIGELGTTQAATSNRRTLRILRKDQELTFDPEAGEVTSLRNFDELRLRSDISNM
jgi:hypothetical protein